MTIPRPRKIPEWLLIVAICSVGSWFTGCAAPSAAMYEDRDYRLNYISMAGDPYAIPVRAQIDVRINPDSLHVAFRSASAKRSIADAVITDLRDNLFSSGEEALQVRVTVERLSSKKVPTVWVIPAVGLHAWGIKSFFHYYILALTEEKDTWTNLGISLLYTPVAVVPYYLLPTNRVAATAVVSTELRLSDGTLVGRYRAAINTVSGAKNDRGLKAVNPQVEQAKGGILKDVLRTALEDIKSQILADRERINRTLEDPFAVGAKGETAVAPTVLQTNDAHNIAVVDLDAFAISVAETQALTNRLRIEFFKTGRFVVLERGQMQNILKEQDFQLSGCTTTDCLVEIGRLLNVESIVAGSISRVGQMYSVEIRLVAVETGKIVAAAVVDMDGSISDLLVKGMKLAATQIARQAP
jgi:TolB-like protein